MAVRILIHGRVQGVGYRAWLVAAAKLRNINGWARNRVDGRVEAVLAGEPQVVRRLIELCRSGPRLARVERIDEFVESVSPAPGFEQRPTV